VSKRTALAAAPALLASFFGKAYAGTTATDPKELFNYALTLELLEDDFYKKMIASSVFTQQLPADQAAIRQISKHETAHVALLTAIVTALAGTPVTTATVKFKQTTFDTLTTFSAQLAVAQQLEDTGVRAYKGRAGELLGLSDITVGTLTYNPLETALRIHSVEARHAAHIRTMRGQTPWITGTGNLDTTPAYTGATPESTTTQSGINLTTANAITPNTTYSAADAAAAFDEILTVAEVNDATRAGGLIGV
jgi:hypothetical protein